MADEFMELRARNIALIERYYRTLAAGAFDALATLHAEDVAFNLVGSTPVSGRWEGRAECFGPLVADAVIGRLVPDGFAFATEWRILCADDRAVTGLMRGGGPALNGERYDQTYGQIFTIGERDGEPRIVELHEFFDTALVERALNDNPTLRLPSEPAHPFRF